MNYQLQMLELIKAITLLCQTELGALSSGKALEERKLSCMSRYITCTCSTSPSGSLSCDPSMFERLAACVVERPSVKGR
jgi:hypothetical protein